MKRVGVLTPALEKKQRQFHSESSREITLPSWGAQILCWLSFGDHTRVSFYSSGVVLYATMCLRDGVPKSLLHVFEMPLR